MTSAAMPQCTTATQICFAAFALAATDAPGSHVAAKPNKKLVTPAEAARDFERRGVCKKAWADAHGVNVQLVYQILAGDPRRSCRRGQSHRIAVLLGLKHGEIVERPHAMTTRQGAAV